MSSTSEEGEITARVGERPGFEAGNVRGVGARELLYRFVAGATTSVAAGAATLAFGARVGGILLAFPAILAASLTLIEEEEDPSSAREDARGAVMGGIALALFAGVAALTLGAVAGALALAALVWLLAAVGGYVLAWLR